MGSSDGAYPNMGFVIYPDQKSLQHFNPFEVGALRILIASLILMPIAIKHLKSFPVKQLKWVVVVALCGNFFQCFCFRLQKPESAAVLPELLILCCLFCYYSRPLLWGINSTKTDDWRWN